MKTTEIEAPAAVRQRLIELAGRTSQDIGLGRIIGQVLAFVYFREEESSLDEIAAGLGLSKAAVSIAGRQLESLGLLERAWKKGDRRNYYRSARHFGVALREGLLAMVRRKMRTIGSELELAEEALTGMPSEEKGEVKFLESRLKRAIKLRKRFMDILDSPLIRLLGARK